MLRPRKIFQLFIRALPGMLIGGGLLWPLLATLGLGEETLHGLFFVLLTALMIFLPEAAESLPVRFLLRLLLFVLLAASGGFARNLFAFLQAAARSSRPAAAALFYADALVPLCAVVMSLFGFLLSAGDAAYALPLVVGACVMIWFAGAPVSLVHYVPAALSMPLLLALNHRDDSPAAPAVSPARLRRALPAALLVVVLAALLSPAYRTAYEPLRQKANEIKQWINDTFFFTDSRDAFSLRMEGWQPMGDDGLGGVPRVPDVPVMEVKGAGKTYLRGAIRDTYNGRAWYDTLSDRRFGFFSLRYQSMRDELLNAALPESGRFDEKSVDITILRPSTTTLFLPQRLRKLTPGARMVPYFNQSGEVFITRNLEAGDSYQARYEAYGADEKTRALARRLYRDNDPGYSDALKQYAALPPHLLPDGVVARLAQKITAGADTPYEKALRIKNYLQQHYAYTLDVPETPEQVDFAAHFLFEAKRGYCTYFATAMTVLARSAGLPARYIEGFVADLPQSGGSAVLTAQNAHAWTEIYVPALGWVTFDATAPSQDGSGESDGESGDSPENSPPPGAPESDPTPSPEPPQTTPSPEPSSDPAPSDEPEASDTPRPFPEEDGAAPRRAFLSILLWLLLAALAAARVYFTLPKTAARRAGQATARLVVWWRAYHEAQAARGFPQADSETMCGYAARVAPENRELSALAAALSAARYGKKQAAAAAAPQAMEKQYKALLQNMTVFQKALLFLRRLPPKKREIRQIKQKIAGLFKKAAIKKAVKSIEKE